MCFYDRLIKTKLKCMYGNPHHSVFTHVKRGIFLMYNRLICFYLQVQNILE